MTRVVEVARLITIRNKQLGVKALGWNFPTHNQALL